MTDSRAKGARGEYLVRDMLRRHTNLEFERIPASGALHYLKGDIYVPHKHNIFCIEVKNYKESHFNDKMFTSRSNEFIKWWSKIIKQAYGGEQEPLLFFKYNRSKIFVATTRKPKVCKQYINVNWVGAYVLLAEEWLEKEKVVFTNGDTIYRPWEPDPEWELTDS
jgi:hypothetical protein